MHLLLVSGLFFLQLQENVVHAQSGWTQKKGELYSKIIHHHLQSNHYYNPAGMFSITNEYKQNSVTLYGEYGLNDKLTLLVDWPVLKRHGFETTEKISGYGDMKLGLKYAISKKVPISISLIPELPIAKSDNYAQNKQDPNTTFNLPTGDGEWNVYGILAISHSLRPLPVYINGYFSYNLRTSYGAISFGDQLNEGFELGWQPFTHIELRSGIKFQHSLSSSNEIISFVRGEGTEYTSFFVGAFYGISDLWGIDINYSDYFHSPQKKKNLYAGATISAGMVYEIKK